MGINVVQGNFYLPCNSCFYRVSVNPLDLFHICFAISKGGRANSPRLFCILFLPNILFIVLQK